MPQAAGGPPKVTKPNITERVNEAVAQMTESQILLRGLGINLAETQQQGNRQQELYGPQIAAMFNAQNQLVQTFLQQLTTLTSKAQEGQSRADYVEIKSQMERLAENIQRAAAQPRDPMQQLLDNYTVLESIQERMAKKNGYQTANLSQAGLAGIGIQLQIEQMKAEAEERRMRHEDEVAERTRHWQKEDLLLAQQFALDNKKFEHDQKVADKRANQFSGILAAIAQGVDLKALMGGGEAIAAAPQPRLAVAAQPPQAVVQPPPAEMMAPEPPFDEQGKPREIQCGTCGQLVGVPSPDAEAVECPTCKAVFDLSQYRSQVEPSLDMVP